MAGSPEGDGAARQAARRPGRAGARPQGGGRLRRPSPPSGARCRARQGLRRIRRRRRQRRRSRDHAPGSRRRSARGGARRLQRSPPRRVGEGGGRSVRGLRRVPQRRGSARRAASRRSRYRIGPCATPRPGSPPEPIGWGPDGGAGPDRRSLDPRQRAGQRGSSGGRSRPSHGSVTVLAGERHVAAAAPRARRLHDRRQRSTTGPTSSAVRELGCDRILAIGSVGGLRPELGVGTFLCPDDFIALQLGLSFSDEHGGERVPAFDGSWRERVLERLATRREAELRDGGVYWQSIGPRFETPAEIRHDRRARRRDRDDDRLRVRARRGAGHRLRGDLRGRQPRQRGRGRAARGRGLRGRQGDQSGSAAGCAVAALVEALGGDAG